VDSVNAAHEARAAANQALHLTAARILVSRDTTPLQRAAAGERNRSALFLEVYYERPKVDAAASSEGWDGDCSRW
jgi:hypothetical protein